MAILDESERRRRIQRVYELVGRHVGCAIIIPGRDATAADVANGGKGTVSFIQTPERELLVTCAHVWDAYVAERQANPFAELAIIGAEGHESILVSDAVEIDKDAVHLDVVTLHLSGIRDRVRACGKEFFTAELWPPPLVAKDDTVIAVGYPGQHQIPDEAASNAVGQPVVNLRPTALVLTVSSSSTRHFVLAENDDDNTRRGIAFDPSLAELKSLGGASGTVYYRYLDGAITVAGIQYEAKGTSALDSAVLVNHAAFIRADGTIDRSGPPFL